MVGALVSSFCNSFSGVERALRPLNENIEGRITKSSLHVTTSRTSVCRGVSCGPSHREWHYLKSGAKPIPIVARSQVTMGAVTER